MQGRCLLLPTLTSAPSACRSVQVQPQEVFQGLEHVVGKGMVLSVMKISQLREGESSSGFLESATYEYAGKLAGWAEKALNKFAPPASEAFVTSHERRESAAITIQHIARRNQRHSSIMKRAFRAVIRAGRAVGQRLVEASRHVLCGEEEPATTCFLALMRHRWAAATCVGNSRWPGELL